MRNIEHDGLKGVVSIQEIPQQIALSPPDFDDFSQRPQRDETLQKIVEEMAVGVLPYENPAARAFHRIDGVANRQFPPQRIEITNMISLRIVDLVTHRHNPSHPALILRGCRFQYFRTNSFTDRHQDGGMIKRAR
jgi:hypothetical protein